MKIRPINLIRTADFQGKPKTWVLSSPFGNEGNLTNAGAYGLTCLLTAVPGIEFARRGFKEATMMGKVGKIAGGAGIMLGLAVPIFAIFKSLNILGRPTGEKNSSSIKSS